uniref:FBD domain-containing protein n=1 Tax=Leersia perrieri TaxID=77586 RepID=A0A0D9XVN7_9ORYZ
MGYTPDRFIKHVNHALQRHRLLVVDRFEVRFALQKQHAEHVDRWVDFASASRIKHFVLDLSPAVRTNRQSEGHKYEFLVNLLNGQNGSPIVSLRLGLVCLKLPSDFLGFTDLKKLELHLANISLKGGSSKMDYIVNELTCSLAHVGGLLIKFSTFNTEATGFTKNQSQFTCLRHLVLKLIINGESENDISVLRLTYIVEASPQLEYFELHMDSDNSGPSTLSINNCICPVVHHHLRRVHMTGLIGLAGQLELASTLF